MPSIVRAGNDPRHQKLPRSCLCRRCQGRLHSAQQLLTGQEVHCALKLLSKRVNDGQQFGASVLAHRNECWGKLLCEPHLHCQVTERVPQLWIVGAGHRRTGHPTRPPACCLTSTTQDRRASCSLAHAIGAQVLSTHAGGERWHEALMWPLRSPLCGRALLPHPHTPLGAVLLNESVEVAQQSGDSNSLLPTQLLLCLDALHQLLQLGIQPMVRCLNGNQHTVALSTNVSEEPLDAVDTLLRAGAKLLLPPLRNS
mmetsp:Transcript_9999/g.23557  ORF Transcript_9999/g.23557 Transcript_9999/m.23557 type:complete len:255 (-) Transcript_9999:455-1219(-)